MNKTLNIYTRVSSDSQEDNTSLKNQRDKGERVAQLIGMKTKLWNEGVGSSSKDDLSNRPVLSELMERVNEGEIKHLYVEFNDRLSRNQKTWGVIRWSLKKNEVLLYNDSDPNPIDLSDPMDELLLGIMSEISVFDNQMRTNRLHSGKMNRVKEGKWLGGPPPFGYQIVDKTLVQHPVESKWVQKMFDTYIETRSIDSVRQMLMNNGVLTRRGNPVWSLGSINKLFTNTHYSGFYNVTNHKTKEFHTINCEPLITYEQRRLVDELLANRSHQSRNVQPNVKHETVLRDLLFCGVCGCGYGVRLFTGRPDKNYYFCRSKEANWRNLREGKKLYDCNVKGSMKLSASDDVVLETVVRTLTQSPLFTKDIKSDSIRKGFIEDFDQEKSKIDSENKRLERESKKVTTAIGHLEGLLLVDEDVDQVRSRIKTLMNKRLELQDKIKQNSKLIKNLNNNKTFRKWTENLQDHIDSMTNLLKNKGLVRERNEFLKSFVERVDVVPSYEDGLTHTLTIQLKLPYHLSEKLWFNPFVRTKGDYDVVEGTHKITVELMKDNPFDPK